MLIINFRPPCTSRPAQKGLLFPRIDQWLAAPGLWTQRITTKPPSDEQAEVAIRALHGAMALEARQGGDLVIA